MFKLASSQHNVNYGVDSTFRIFLQDEDDEKRIEYLVVKATVKVHTTFPVFRLILFLVI